MLTFSWIYFPLHLHNISPTDGCHIIFKKLQPPLCNMFPPKMSHPFFSKYKLCGCGSTIQFSFISPKELCSKMFQAYHVFFPHTSIDDFPDNAGWTFHFWKFPCTPRPFEQLLCCQLNCLSNRWQWIGILLCSFDKFSGCCSSFFHGYLLASEVWYDFYYLVMFFITEIASWKCLEKFLWHLHLCKNELYLFSNI